MYFTAVVENIYIWKFLCLVEEVKDFSREVRRDDLNILESYDPNAILYYFDITRRGLFITSLLPYYDLDFIEFDKSVDFGFGGFFEDVLFDQLIDSPFSLLL